VFTFALEDSGGAEDGKIVRLSAAATGKMISLGWPQKFWPRGHGRHRAKPGFTTDVMDTGG